MYLNVVQRCSWVVKMVSMKIYSNFFFSNFWVVKNKNFTKSVKFFLLMTVGVRTSLRAPHLIPRDPEIYNRVLT